MIHDKVLQLTIPHNTGVETLVVHVYVVDGVGVRVAMPSTLGKCLVHSMRQF